MAKKTVAGDPGSSSRPALKGKGPFPATKQTNKPIGKASAPGKKPPKQTNKPTGSPLGGN